jgi:RNA polymerase sigma factor (sigma-70 family)
LVLLAQENERLYLARALEANYGLVVERASRSSVSGLEHDELISEMKIAAINAIRRYEPDKGKWSTYLYACLRNAMRALIKQRQNKERYKMDNTLEWQDNYGRAYKDELHWGDDWPIVGLSTKEGALLELYYLHENTLKHVSKVMGWRTVQWTYKRIQTAIARAQDIMAGAI